MPEKQHKNWKKLSKEKINQFPLRQFEGPIEIIYSPKQVPEAIKQLSQEKILGFDTETRPAFKKGEKYSPALLQLAGEKKTFIFQIKKTGLPSNLLEILDSPQIIKAGVSIAFDISELRTVSDFEPSGFVELSDIAKEIGIQNHGLRGLAALVLGFRISKGPKTSNWENNRLSHAQISYAATDAWVGRELYLKLKEF